MSDIPLLKKMNHKVQILRILKVFMQNKMEEIQLFNKNIFEEMLQIIENYLEYSMFDFDEMSIELCVLITEEMKDIS